MHPLPARYGLPDSGWAFGALFGSLGRFGDLSIVEGGSDAG